MPESGPRFAQGRAFGCILRARRGRGPSSARLPRLFGWTVELHWVRRNVGVRRVCQNPGDIGDFLVGLTQASRFRVDVEAFNDSWHMIGGSDCAPRRHVRLL